MNIEIEKLRNDMIDWVLKNWSPLYKSEVITIEEAKEYLSNKEKIKELETDIADIERDIKKVNNLSKRDLEDKAKEFNDGIIIRNKKILLNCSEHKSQYAKLKLLAIFIKRKYPKNNVLIGMMDSLIKQINERDNICFTDIQFDQIQISADEYKELKLKELESKLTAVNHELTNMKDSVNKNLAILDNMITDIDSCITEFK